MWLAAVLGIVAIGVVDFASGAEVRIFPLYYAPISVLAWRAGPGGALVGTVLSAGSWLGSNLLAGLQFSHPGIWVTNTFVQAASFAVVGFLIAGLRATLERERGLSRTDSLTSLLNSRAFYEEAGRILALCRRHGRPATVAYVDLDHFKGVNDTKGHQEGDELLREVACGLRESTRPSDLCARLGGDEFVVLLPELGPEEAAAALDRLHRLLGALPTLRASDVTASIGGVTFLAVPDDLEGIVRRADARMYAVKAAGRNRVAIEVVDDESVSEARPR